MNEGPPDVKVLKSAESEEARTVGAGSIDDDQIKQLVDDVLLPVARRVAGAKRNRVDLQPESIAASVIKDHFDEVIEACGGSEQAARNLKGAIRHKLLDRLKKGGRWGPAVALSQLDSRGNLDPQGSGAGPATLVTEQERHESLRQLLLAAFDDPADQVLIDSYVMQGRDWCEVAAALHISESAARKRMSRLRGRLTPILLEPLRTRLSAVQWCVAEGVLIDRRSPTFVALALGMDTSTVEEMIRGPILQQLTDSFGCTLLAAPLSRLLGRQRND